MWPQGRTRWVEGWDPAGRSFENRTKMHFPAPVDGTPCFSKGILMTLQEIKLFFAYNAWASDRIFEALAPLPVEDYFKDLKGSHGGIHGTLTHLVGAEKIWLSRWAGSPDATMLKAEEFTTLADLHAAWEKVGRETAVLVAKMNDKKLQETLSITTSKGIQYTQTYQQMFQHLVNHSTYHRGQIAAMMRQVGATPTATDLIAFYRQVGGAVAGR